MGTLWGHIFPGAYFVVIGIWWCLNIFRDYYRSQLANAPKFVNRPWYHIITCSYVLPVESMVKVGMAVIGMINEYIAALDSQGNFLLASNIGSAQHMAMYFFFGLNGATDLLIHYGAPLPEGLEAVTGMLAFLVEGFLFYNHLHDRSQMDIQVHMFLFYVIVACVLSIFLEIYHRHDVISSLCRAYFTLTQGSWLFQVGFILYPPTNMDRWDQSDHNQMMMVTLIFTSHLGINFLVVMMLGLLVRVAGRRCCSSMNNVAYQSQENRSTNILFNKTSNNNWKNVSKKLLQSDSEEDNFVREPKHEQLVPHAQLQ